MSAYTAEYIAALERAIASGVRSVSYRGTTTVYRDLSEMKEALRLAQEGVDGDSGLQRTRQIYPYLKRDY